VQLFAQAHHAHLDVALALLAQFKAKTLRNVFKAQPGIGRLGKRQQQAGLGGSDLDSAGGAGEVEFFEFKHGMLMSSGAGDYKDFVKKSPSIAFNFYALATFEGSYETS
jgi:hypothetical protein